MTAPQTLVEWLSLPECMSTLERAARSVIRQSKRIELPEGLLPCELHDQCTPSAMEECAQIVAHEIWLFLRTRSASWCEKVPLQWLADGGGRFLIQKIAQDYLLFLKDRARTYGSSPWRAFYRKIRQILQEEKTIHYRATPQGAFYSLAEDARELKGPLGQLAPPYEQWDSPLGIAQAAHLHKKENLLRLARFFWRQATDYLGKQAHYLPVRELVHYLTRHYTDLDAVGVHLLSDHEPEADSVAQPGAESAPEHSFVRSRLPELARSMVTAWTPKQQAAFSMIHGEGMTLEDAAARLGYRGASGASHVYRTALDRLRDFSLLWPGLSPPDLDEALFDEFVEYILACCKRDV